MKKALALSALTALSLGLAACGSSESNIVAVDNLTLNDSDSFATGNVEDLGTPPLANDTLESGNVAAPELTNDTSEPLANAE